METTTWGLSLLLLSCISLLWSSASFPVSEPNNSMLRLKFYDKSCPFAEDIVRSIVWKAVIQENRMAASLLRLHFHDCFVQGCDASLLLDNDTRMGIVSEKGSNANINSARGFEVIDEIKRELEKACPHTVSCADILTLAARDAVVLTGGPWWEVVLGRRDSTGASLSDSNNNIPQPNSTLQNLIQKSERQGLSVVDLVALTGAHTIGQSRCTSFRQRLYNQNDFTLEKSYHAQLSYVCPRSGGDNNLSPLDAQTPMRFDNSFFKSLVSGRGLLNSDAVLFSNSATTMGLVMAYAVDEELFSKQFVESMDKMGNISPLTGTLGQIRTNCHTVN